MKHIIGITVLLGLALLLAFSGCISSQPLESADGMEKVSVRFPIAIIEVGQAPFYVAKEKGFFEEEGLDVTFNHGSAELNPVKMVTARVDEIGLLGGPDTLLVARGKEHPLKAVAVFHKNANFVVIVTMKNSGLETLQGLEGKKVGFFYGHISTDILHALFKNEGINVSEVGVKYYDYSQMIAGQVDAEAGWNYFTIPLLRTKGIEVNIIDPADYGLNSHGYTIFAREDFIESNPETVERFVRATMRGLQFTVNNPEEAIEILTKYGEDLNKEDELARLPEYAKVVSKAPYGLMEKAMFQETYDRLDGLGLIEKSFSVEEAFDASFVNSVNISD